jgi:eukaryotic-like serine/threonine-protein kinase
MAATPDDTIESYEATLQAHGIDARALSLDETGTVATSANPRSSVVDYSRLARVCGGDADEIVIKRKLTRGGLGEILLGEQASLGREVAVKLPLPGRDAAEERELLIEARVVAQIEHPNIVPVHLAGTTSDGRPVMVMKRIEGRSWRAMLDEERDLARDIDILMDVCRALHFAHSRGVVHRDVKPANVMVGSFGEVYLVDWGIAVGVSDQAPLELPRARDVEGISGSPWYMAPEMASPVGVVDERADVFLAGAVLFELITGRPPYSRASVAESLLAAHKMDRAPFPEDAPEELVQICSRAMARDRTERYQSAGELRAALEGFKEHAAARRMCKEAEELFAQARALPASAPAREVMPLFSEIRFGFAQALRTWPGSARARDGLRQAIEWMAEREIAAGHYDSAQLLVDELEQPAPSLLEALRGLKARREAEARSAEELARVLRETDKIFAERERAKLLVGAGIWWVICGAAFTLLQKNGWEARGGTYFVASLGSLVALVVIVASSRSKVLVATRAARSALATMFISTLTLVVLYAICAATSAPLSFVTAGSLLVIGGGIADRAAEDTRIWPAAVLAWGSIVPVLLLPEWSYLVTGAAVMVSMLATASVAWRGGARPNDEERAP